MKRTLAAVSLALVIGLNTTLIAQDTDPLLDLPIETPVPNAAINSLIAALSTTTHIKWKPGDPIPVPPPPPDDGQDDPRDEPPPVFFGEEIESENGTIVYVLDTSGSMGYNDRLLQAKKELAKSLTQLSPNFRFNLVTYSCELRRLFPQLVPATDEYKYIAISYLMQLGCNGGTGTGPAVALALRDREVQAVVLLTDGEPNCGADGMNGHRAMIRTHNLQGATINVFGIDANGDYRAFCMNVAADSGGSYFDVSSGAPSRGKQ